MSATHDVYPYPHTTMAYTYAGPNIGFEFGWWYECIQVVGTSLGEGGIEDILFLKPPLCVF